MHEQTCETEVSRWRGRCLQSTCIDFYANGLGRRQQHTVWLNNHTVGTEEEEGVDVVCGVGLVVGEDEGVDVEQEHEVEVVPNVGDQESAAQAGSSTASVRNGNRSIGAAGEEVQAGGEHAEELHVTEVQIDGAGSELDEKRSDDKYQTAEDH